MLGKVISMNKDTKKVKIETKGKEEEHTVGKAIFNQGKFREGDTIEFNIKGKNFEFLKKVNAEEVTNKQNNFSNNRNFGGGGKNKNLTNSEILVKIKQYPYNFVSLGDKVIEKGERKLGKNTGVLKCKLTNYTPLFIMGESIQVSNHTEEKFYREGGIPTIPGSSLKGTVRNVIDAMTNSVIRNVEGDRLEQRMGAGKFEKAVFGIIEALPEGNKPGKIIEAKKIKVITKEKIGDKKFIDNGKKFSKDYNGEDGLIERIFLKKSIHQMKQSEIEIRKGVTIKEYLIRNYEEYKDYLSNKNDGVRGVLWFSSPIYGKKHEKILVSKENGRVFEFSKEEYEDFKYIIKQRKDRIEGGKEKESSLFYYDKKLEEGDPLLFQVVDGKRAEHLAFSEIPRLRYKYSPLDLVPKEFIPSDSLKTLSFSEKLFGTIGDNTKKEKKNEKEKNEEIVAIAGRVFFGDAKNYSPKMIDNGELVTLKAFGEPHPTLTTFYLDNIDKDYNEKEGIHIRGRKFYWHHKDKVGKEFKNYRNTVEMPQDKNGKRKFAYNSSLELMDINNKFEFEVHFENLTDEELGILIYSLELEEGLLHKVGKGKAFGFGSCKIEIDEFLLEGKNKYNSFFENIFEKKEKSEYIQKAKEKYINENRKNIKELKAILSKTNDLDFSHSPFPEEQKYNKKTGLYSGEKNTLNWFINNKSGDKKIQLLNILDKNPKN